MPDSDPEELPLDPAEDPAMGNRAPTKRRGGHTPPLQHIAANAAAPSLKAIPASLVDRPGRRRRLIIYVAAFATMLALSSVLDLRRAALNARRTEKVHLALPSGAVPALEEESAAASRPVPADGAAVADTITASANARKSGASSPPAAKLPAAPASTVQQPPTVPPAPQEPTQRPPAQETHLSAQELKDDVDQLIAHVDQESSTAAAAAAANGTSSATASTTTGDASASSSSRAEGANSPATVSVPASNAGNRPAPVAPGPSGATAGSPQPATVTNSTAAAEDGRASSEDLFVAAQSKIDALMKNETMKPHLDVNELRTLHALALQGSRGDCLQATDPRSGGSLFKTDAEAAGADIEKTDPLWGAWCLFSSWYRTDAMREYVLRARAFRARVNARFAAAAVLAAAEGGAGRTGNTSADSATGGDSASATVAQRKTFDQNAASLDDVLPPEAQMALRAKAELVLPHLHEGDVRYLAALSLQATFGDCGPYAQTRPAAASSGGVSAAGTAVDGAEDDATRLRPLTEPLLGRTATRGEGALWGAWCVFMRRKRAVAAMQLSDRVEILLKQLSQKLSPTVHTPVMPAVSRAAPLGAASATVPGGTLRMR